MIADLDTLLTALYVELTDRIIPARGFGRRGPGKPPEVTDAELICIAVAQVLLRYDDERHWLRAASARIGHPFPRLLGQAEYNQRVKDAGPDLELSLIRPARKDEKTPRPFPNWLRQRIEAIIWTLKHLLDLKRHGGRVPAGLWARIVQRLLALNACI